MAYINTGYARYKTLTVTKGSYTHTYNLTDGFTAGDRTYASISDNGLATLDQTDYEKRLQDFTDYVYDLEDGLQTDCPDIVSGARSYNTTLCPLTQDSSD